MVMKMVMFNNGFADKSKERLPLIGSLEGVDGEEGSGRISFSWLLKKPSEFPLPQESQLEDFELEVQS